MVADLIRALLAAAAVGLLPGWFWARTLCGASEGLITRLLYSAALSVGLVPAVALAAARLWPGGGGITAGVALFGAFAVFLGGLLAYGRFGSAPRGAKATEGSGGSRTVPWRGSVEVPVAGYPTLVALGAAAVVALGSVWGFYEGWRAAPFIVLLVLVAGVAHLLTRLPEAARAEARADAPAGAHTEEPAPRALSGSAVVHYGLLSVVVGLVLARGYLGPVRHDWPYARGVDIYEHAVMTEMMLSRGTTESFMLYPPGLHALTALLSRLSGLEPLELFAVLAPVLLLLTSLSCYALARNVWGWEAGVAAAFISGVILVGNFHHLSEARFPNLIGGQFLLVLTLAALLALYSSPTVRQGLLLAILGSSVVFYHQVASFTLAQVLFLVTVLFVPYLLARERRTGLALLVSFAVLGLLSVVYAWDTYDLGTLAVGLLEGGEGTGRGGEAVGMALGTKLPYPFEHLLLTATQPALWLGLLGALLLLVGGRQEDRTKAVASALVRATLLFWALLLFIGSRTNLSGFPDRFERDLGVPLALLAAFALVSVIRSAARARGALTLAAGAGAALAVAVLLGAQTVHNFELADGPAGRPKDRPPPPAVAAAGEWLAQNNTGGRIIATPYLNYVPSRGMLAMGGYAGMQSYDIPRIQRARDLPPFGAGPLWDAQWVLHNPESERTQRIIEENDVRYIVFHKRYPGMPWRTFKEKRDLYRATYENESVVIFAPLQEG